MEYITTEGKITFNDTALSFETLKESKDYWVHSLYFLILLAIFNISNGFTRDYLSIFTTIAVFLLMIPHLKRLFRNIFINYSADRITFSKIASVETMAEKNELEQRVKIKLKSGRERIVIFRSKENQMDSFLHTLNSHLDQSAINTRLMAG